MNDCFKVKVSIQVPLAKVHTAKGWKSLWVCIQVLVAASVVLGVTGASFLQCLSLLMYVASDGGDEKAVGK